jgi:hypothetical protein
MMLLPPLISFDAVDRGDLNRCLVAWGHKMGPWERPTYREHFHGLRHNGALVAVAAAGSLIRETAADFTRDQAFELGRLCAARPALCRVILRLWREFVLVKVGRSRSGTDTRNGGRRGRDKVIWGWCADAGERAARATP